MKAYVVSVLIIDFDGLGEKSIQQALETVRYPNNCLHPKVLDITQHDIGDWQDEHPLNQRGLSRAEIEKFLL